MAADGSVKIEIKGDSSDFEAKLSKLGDIAGTAMKGVVTAVTAATTAVAGMAAAAVNVGSGFESSMSQVAATMGITNRSLPRVASPSTSSRRPPRTPAPPQRFRRLRLRRR